MICQQPFCWQIFYYRSPLSRFPSSRVHSHSYVAPVITATELDRILVVAFVEIKTRCTVLPVVTQSELVTRLHTSGNFAVLATVFKLTSAPVEGQRRPQHRRQRQNPHRPPRPQTATRTQNPTRIAFAVPTHFPVNPHTGPALTTAPEVSLQTSLNPAT